MKKIIINILIIFGLLFSNFSLLNAGNIDFSDAGNAVNKIKGVSMSESSGTVETQVTNISYNVFKTIKIVIGGLLVIYIVHAGVMMIFSMGGDEKALSNSKRSIWYGIVGLLFINIPGLLYNSFWNKQVTDDVTSTIGDTRTIYDRNIFMNSDIFGSTLGSIITFLEIALVSIAVFMIVLQGIKMILSIGEEKAINEGKQKILWSLAGLIFIGIMEVWRNVIFVGDFKGKGQDLFATLVNLALFFAGPTAIFFISLAGYYYITSGGDDEKVKKAKNIIINTLIATLILLGMYTVLLDLKTLNF